MFFDIKKDKKEEFAKVAALLIHAAKIDQNFLPKEEKIIEKTMLEIGVDKTDIEKTMQEGKKIEENSNQILDFTQHVKNMSENKKIKIIESLWKIIYSDNEADMYETSLMRRLAGLLYIEDKTMGDIKEKIKNQIL